MSDRPAFWFPVKRYGWGWGLPVRWQGWVVFALTALVKISKLQRQLSAASVLGKSHEGG